MRRRSARAPIVIAALAIALIGPPAIAAEEQPTPLPPPGQWVLVVPAGSVVTVPGAEVRLPAPPRPRPRFYSSKDPARLRRAMEIEGPDYSFEQLRAYKRRMFAGGVIGTLGVLVAYVSVYVGIFGTPEAAGIFAAGAGGVALAIGLPLFISGSLGRERQLLLWRKDEIMKGPYWTAGVVAGPDGASLGASIVF